MDKRPHITLAYVPFLAAAFLACTALVLTSCANNSTTPAGLDSTVLETNNQLRAILTAEPATEVGPIGWDGQTQTLTTSTGETHTFPSVHNTSEVKYVMWGSNKSWCIMGVTEKGTSTPYGSEENNTCAEWLTEPLPTNDDSVISLHTQNSPYDYSSQLWFRSEKVQPLTQSGSTSLIEQSNDGGVSWTESTISPTAGVEKKWETPLLSCNENGCLAIVETVTDNTLEGADFNVPNAVTVLSYNPSPSSPQWEKVGTLPSTPPSTSVNISAVKLTSVSGVWFALTNSKDYIFRYNADTKMWEELPLTMQTNSGKSIKGNITPASSQIASNGETLMVTVVYDAQDEGNPDLGGNSGGVARSTNQGETWELTTEPLTPNTINSITPGGENVWLAYEYGPNGQVWKTTNNGDTWENITQTITNPKKENYWVDISYSNKTWVATEDTINDKVTQYVSFDPTAETWWPKNR